MGKIGSKYRAGTAPLEEERFISFLKSKGLKFTPERKAVLKAVFSLHKHFDVDELHERLSRQEVDISRATIYRTIPFLLGSGLVKEGLRCLGKTAYEHVFGHPHHDHMVCIKCGRIIEFKNEKLENLQDEICRNYGFKPLEHRLGIRGYCRKCSGENKQIGMKK